MGAPRRDGALCRAGDEPGVNEDDVVQRLERGEGAADEADGELDRLPVVEMGEVGGWHRYD